MNRLLMMTIVLILGSRAAHATPTVPGQYATAKQWTDYYAQIYIGGSWDVACAFEDASWDPHLRVEHCVARNSDPAATVPYIQMEYATFLGEDGGQWTSLPFWVTYTWPETSYAAAWWMEHTVPPYLQLDGNRHITCSIDAHTGRCGCDPWAGDLCITEAWSYTLPLGYEIDCGYYISYYPGDVWPPIQISFTKCMVHTSTGSIVGACDVANANAGGGPVGQVTCSAAQATP